MRPSIFERHLELDVPADELFRWHGAPGAFARLLPPWGGVRLIGRAAPLVEGARQRMLVGLGPLRRTWKAEIRDVREGRQFRDVQLSGPFARWTHTHSMRSLGPARSRLEDRIEYALPLGPVGRLLGGALARRSLERTFAYRHRIVATDLARHSATRGRPSMDILVTGSSGLVGSALTAFLTTGGHRVRRLVRSAPRGADEFRWDPSTGELDGAALEGVDAVVHLAGEGIAARRWSPQQKDRIRRSRREGTRHLVEAIRATARRPHVLVSASAVGIYGDRGDEELDEQSEPGRGFLAEVCREWEAAVDRLSGARTVPLRFGMILSPAGGALRKMLVPFKLGLGGRLGDGRQWVSWIAIDDAVGAIHHALVTESLQGAANAVAPNPVTNAELTATLGRVLGRPTVLPMPAVAARLAFGELADQLLLAGQRVRPRRLLDTGFEFRYPTLEEALRHVLGRTKGAATAASGQPA